MVQNMPYNENTKSKEQTVFFIERMVAVLDYRLVNVNGHIEVYDGQGVFQFSADTMQEAMADLREFFDVA